MCRFQPDEHPKCARNSGGHAIRGDGGGEIGQGAEGNHHFHQPTQGSRNWFVHILIPIHPEFPYSLFSYLYFHRSAVQYQVINDVSRLSNDEMERIVAVFVHVSWNFKFTTKKIVFTQRLFKKFLWFQGPVWQFKGWNYFGLNDQRKMVNKWDSKPVNIFSDVQAFHIYYDDIKVSFSFRKPWLCVHYLQIFEVATFYQTLLLSFFPTLFRF